MKTNMKTGQYRVMGFVINVTVYRDGGYSWNAGWKTPIVSAALRLRRIFTPKVNMEPVSGNQ